MEENNTKPKISVIVPVYNVEKYLRRCVDCILAQTFTDFEVLLIDDGSTDGSGRICDEYAKKDHRVRVFHKENGGVSSARNLGLDNAQGEWVTFIDADDYLIGNILVHGDSLLLENTDVDIIELPYNRGTQNYLCKKKTIIGSHAVNKHFTNSFKNELWAYIFRKEVIGLFRFPLDLKIGEDVWFLINCLSQCAGYAYSPYGIYQYTINNSSVMQTSTKKRIIEQHSIFLKYSKPLIQKKNQLMLGYYFKQINLYHSINPNVCYDIYKQYDFSLIDVIESNLNVKNKVKYIICLLKLLWKKLVS